MAAEPGERDGWIYFDSPGGLSRIRADGGTPELFIPLDSAAREIGHAWPTALPNKKGLVYRSRRNLDPSDFDLVAYDFATKERHVLTKGLLARYVDPGYLVYLRADGAVLAAPFDQDKLKLTGPAVPLFEGVMTKPFGSADIAISGNGTLAYVPGLALERRWRRRAGHGESGGCHLPPQPRGHLQPRRQLRQSASPPTEAGRIRDDRGSIAGCLGQAASLRPHVAPHLRHAGSPIGRGGRRTESTSCTSPPGDSVSAIFGAIWKKRADGSSPPELVWKVPGAADRWKAFSRGMVSG